MSAWSAEKVQLSIDPPDQNVARRRGPRERDVLLEVRRDAGGTLRDQLDAALRAAVRDGRLAARTVLPSSRALAAELGVSRGVVVEVYGQLAAEGVLDVRPRGATRVADVPPVSGTTKVPSPSSSPSPEAPPLDLLPLSGELGAFPRRAWARAVREALRVTPDTDLDYGHPLGPSSARRAVAEFLGRSRGVVATPASVALTAGVTDGLVAVARDLAERGARRVAVEDPGFGVHRTALAVAGLEPVPVAVDEGGMRVDEVPGDVAAVLVTAAHQWPTGHALAPERRAALVRRAAATGTLVLEDDYDGELRYAGPPVGALQSLAPDHVVHLGSVSKTLSPALRIGWVVAPEAVVRRLVRPRILERGGGPALEPLAFAHMIAAGDLDRHLRQRRRTYVRRRRLVVEALRRHLPHRPTGGVPAGLHVPLHLDGRVDPGELVAAGARRGVRLAAERGPVVGRSRTIVLVGFGRVSDAAVDRAVACLAAAVADVGG